MASSIAATTAKLSRRVIITGASSGVGRALALRMAGDGVGLFLCGRNRTNLEKVGEDCKALGSPVALAVGDVGCEIEVGKMWGIFTDTFGPKVEVDVLVANAGLNRVGPVEKGTAKDYDEVMNTNVKGIWLWLRHVVPVMKLQKSGQIVVTNSVRGLRGGANSALYSSSKFAVRGLMQSVRAEMRPFGVKVGSVYPGGIATAWWEDEKRGGRPPGTIDTSAFLSADSVALAMMNLINQPPCSNIEEVIIEPAPSAL